jgi:hypothetical protein
MKNAGSICHRAICHLLGSAPSADGPVVDPAAMNYSDELAINTDECRFHDKRPGVPVEECAVDELCAVFERAALSGFILQADKLQLLQPEVDMCGIIVGHGTHRLPAQRMQAIANWPLPPDPSRLSRWRRTFASTPRASRTTAARFGALCSTGVTDGMKAQERKIEQVCLLSVEDRLVSSLYT